MRTYPTHSLARYKRGSSSWWADVQPRSRPVTDRGATTIKGEGLNVANPAAGACATTQRGEVARSARRVALSATSATATGTPSKLACYGKLGETRIRRPERTCAPSAIVANTARAGADRRGVSIGTRPMRQGKRTSWRWSRQCLRRSSKGCHGSREKSARRPPQMWQLMQGLRPSYPRGGGPRQRQNSRRARSGTGFCSRTRWRMRSSRKALAPMSHARLEGDT